MTGHLIGASGAVEAIVCIKTILEGCLPPTINYEYPDPECDLDYVPNDGAGAHVDAALSNSLGFGGHNTALDRAAVRGLTRRWPRRATWLDAVRQVVAAVRASDVTELELANARVSRARAAGSGRVAPAATTGGQPSRTTTRPPAPRGRAIYGRLLSLADAGGARLRRAKVTGSTPTR